MKGYISGTHSLQMGSRGYLTSLLYRHKYDNTINRTLMIYWRLLAIIGGALSLTFSPHEKYGLDWTACFLINIPFIFMLFFWLSLVRSRLGVEFSYSKSWQEPFLPANQKPLQFWLLASIALMIGGFGALADDLYRNASNLFFGVTFILMGILIRIALFIWIKIFEPKQPKAGVNHEGVVK